MNNDEIERLLCEYAATYPPLIIVEQAAAIAAVPVGTIYDWSSRGLLDAFKHKRGRRVRLGRDLFVHWLFGNNGPSIRTNT